MHIYILFGFGYLDYLVILLKDWVCSVRQHREGTTVR